MQQPIQAGLLLCQGYILKNVMQIMHRFPFKTTASSYIVYDKTTCGRVTHRVYVYSIYTVYMPFLYSVHTFLYSIFIYF